MAAILNHLLSSTPLIPIVGALAILLLARDDQPSRARWIAVATAAACLLRSCGLWLLYDPDGKTWQFAERWDGPIGISLFFGADGTSLGFLVLTSLVALVAVLASWQEITTRVRHFYALLLLAEAAIFGVFIALDLLVFFFFWQVTLLSLYLLIHGWGDARASPLRFVAAAVGVSVLMLGGMVALYLVNPSGTSPYSSDITLLHTRTLPQALQTGVFIAFGLAFAATMTLFPLHRWSVDAQTAAPTAVSVLLAAVVTKMGAYGLFRLLLPVAPDASRQFGPIVMWLAVASIVLGAFRAWRQQDLKRLIAYATVSYAGVMIVGLFALTPAGVGGSIVRQLGHGLWIPALIICAAIVRERTGSRDLSGAAGLRRAIPMLAVLLYATAAAAVALSGPLRFVDEGWRFGSGTLLSLVAAISMFATVACVLPWLRSTIVGDFTGVTGFRRGLSTVETATLVPVIAIAIGLAVNPRPVLQQIETSVGRVVARIHPEMAPYLRMGSDCPTAAAPDPAGPPPGFILVQPCAEGH